MPIMRFVMQNRSGRKSLRIIFWNSLRARLWRCSTLLLTEMRFWNTPHCAALTRDSFSQSCGRNLAFDPKPNLTPLRAVFFQGKRELPMSPRQREALLREGLWGLYETRDMLLQFYVTITRMFQGSVSYTNMMGPLGIVTSGAHFATKGMDWLLWFLAMISANLAVVNFLPIPIVDGGLFTFLVLEKIQGKPLSPKAQAVAQIVGFAVIISVFLFAAYFAVVDNILVKGENAILRYFTGR